MDQSNIIRDLLYWIDTHLDQPLFLDNVAAKAGYSKWHLQRMFKNITQQAIGSYIRARRLSRAAVALRLTSRPILVLHCNTVLIHSKPLLVRLKNNLALHQLSIVAVKSGVLQVCNHQSL